MLLIPKLKISGSLSMCLFKKKAPVPGVFSFVRDKNLRFRLEHDYTTCLPLVKEIPSAWEEVRSKACPIHSETSYNISMKVMGYIAVHGWEDFVRYKPFISSS
jgi:hypothetical protein